MAHTHVCLNQLVIPWDNKILGDFPKYVSPQKRPTSLCSNDTKYSYNTRNTAQNFMFADIKKKLESWGLNLELSYASDAGCWKLLLQRFFPPTQLLAELISCCSWDETALMTQFSHFSDHLQPPFKVPLPRSAGLWLLVKCPSPSY